MNNRPALAASAAGYHRSRVQVGSRPPAPEGRPSTWQGTILPCLALKADPAIRADFVKEMQRFLPAATVRETVEQESYWEFLTELVRSEGTRAMTVV